MLGIAGATGGFTALAAIWLHPGVALSAKVMRSVLCVCGIGIVLAIATQLRTSIDLSEDRRNSFPAADQQALAGLRQPLVITVHMAPEDPRYVDLQRNVLSKLERTLPDVTVRLATIGQTVLGSTSEESYGEVEYSYSGRSAKSRSTSHREVLPLLYGLAGMPIPVLAPGGDFPGYPLVANGWTALPWFLGGLPLLILVAWWWSRRPPHIPSQFIEDGGQS